MNREIKFRVWDSEEKCWMSPDLWLIDYEGNLIYNDDDSDGKGFIYVDKLVIQQFTGLKDKNEKEIYEGDIVKFKTKGYAHGPESEDIHNGKVWFDSDDLSWSFGKWTHTITDSFEWGYAIHEIRKDTLEVIGNIFENSELLK